MSKEMHIERFFSKGGVKYVLLELLEERPMHGYEIMRLLEKRSGGIYVASAGTVYPTLHRLEKQGLVIAEPGKREKKVYCITNGGRRLLANYTEQVIRESSVLNGRYHDFHLKRGQFKELSAAIMEVARLAFIAGLLVFDRRELRPALQQILAHTRQDLHILIGDTQNR